MTLTRIKICGLTREDMLNGGRSRCGCAGICFLSGEVPASLPAARAASLASALPAFVSAVGLFVNAKTADVAVTSRQVRLSLLQFDGDETPGQCHEAAVASNLPFIRVFRVRTDTTADDLLQCERIYRDASPFFKGLLLDTFTDADGGAGKVFNGSLVSKEIGPRVVLSGGLSAQNVAGAIAQLRPFAVDISSGVEAARGIKDARENPCVHPGCPKGG